MQLRKERFSISFNPRHRLLQVSLVVECGLGGGHTRRADSSASDAIETASERRPPARQDRRAVRASRRLRRARAARQGQ
jgi:hypothetical protein